MTVTESQFRQAEQYSTVRNVHTNNNIIVSNNIIASVKIFDAVRHDAKIVSKSAHLPATMDESSHRELASLLLLMVQRSTTTHVSVDNFVTTVWITTKTRHI